MKSITLSGYRLTRQELDHAVEYPQSVVRPLTRGDCQDGERPCPFVSCKWHLYLDVIPSKNSIRLNFPSLAVDELTETCALDVADKGGVTLEQVAKVMNLTRERIRQLETQAVSHMHKKSP